MEVLMELCPACSYWSDNEGSNILHVAVKNNKLKAIDFIFQDESLTNLINQKDKNGNTPIHLLVASNFEKMEMLMDSRVNINALNNQGHTPLDKTSSDDQRNRLLKALALNTSSVMSCKTNKTGQKKTHKNEIKTDKYFGIVDNLVVVAALIATSSFGAALTVPGGFDSMDEGTPFLLRKLVIQAFIVANAIAFSFSCSVLFGHNALLFYRHPNVEASPREKEYIDGKIEDMYYLTTWALLAMAMAFVTGVYVVLTPSLALANSVCFMTLLLIVFNIHKDSYLRYKQVNYL